jgi:hypothetical protein
MKKAHAEKYLEDGGRDGVASREKRQERGPGGKHADDNESLRHAASERLLRGRKNEGTDS